MSDERRNRDLRYFLGIFTVFMVISFLYVFDVHGASELMVFLMMLAMLSLYGYRTSNRHNKWQLKVFVETVLTALFLYIILTSTSIKHLKLVCSHRITDNTLPNQRASTENFPKNRH